MSSPIAPLNLSATIGSGDPVDVRQFHFASEMSTLFEASVLALADNPDIDLDAVAGQEATLTLRWGTGMSRTIRGLVRTFRQVQAEDQGRSTYQWTIVPTLWLTTQRRNHRMFQLMSEVDIVMKLLGEWGISPVLKLSETYKKRKYRVQYGESDFRFICRMLEDAGISFTFDWEGDCALVLTDAPQTGPARAPLAFRDHPTRTDREHATGVHIERNIRPGKVVLRDHDYRRPPSYKLLGTAQDGPGIEERLERFHYTPGAFLFESGKGESTPVADDKGKYRIDEEAGKALAQKRLDAKRATAKVLSFETNTYDPSPGSVVTFLDHPKSDLAPGKRWLVVAAELRGTRNADWSLSCRAVSADNPYHPDSTTPKPVVNGVESATVVGPPGEEIHTDEFGRVRVHFHWDRESKMDEQSSCWIHVSQAWGGAMFGGVNLPRVGQEVLVDFLGGDPDRPVIVGRVFTNLQRVPYKLPDNKTQSGWKSASTGGTGGYNEIMFEDAAGKELVRVQAERDLQKLVKHDERVSIRHNRSTYVGSIDATTVGDTHVVMIAPPAEGGPQASSSITMTDKKIVLDTGAGATITLDRDKITIEADDLVEIWGKKRGVNLHAPAPGGQTNLFTGDSFTVSTQTIVMTGNDVSICAVDTLKLDGTGSATLSSDGTTSVSGKGSATLSSDGTTSVSGKGSATLSSSGTTNVSGTPVQLNGPGLFAGRVTEQAPATITTGAALVLVGGASFPFPVVMQDDGSLKVGDHITVKAGAGRYEDFQNRVMRDLGIMASTSAGLQRLKSIDNNPGGHDVTIREYSKAEADRWGENNSLNYPQNGNAGGTYDKDGNLVPGRGCGSEIGYNPDIGLGPGGNLPKEPADAVLFHELGHADHAAYGIDRGGESLNTGPLAGYENREEWQTIEGGVNQPGGTQVADVPVSPSENEYLGQRGYPYRRTDHGNGYKPA